MPLRVHTGGSPRPAKHRKTHKTELSLRATPRLPAAGLGPTAPPGAVAAVRASGRAERIDRNPGVSAPWSPPRARWRAWADPTAVVGVSPGPPDWRLPSAALETLGPPASALYRALLLGDKRGLSLAIRAAFERGAREVVAVDRVPTRLATAELFGATPANFETGDPLETVHERSQGRGADACIEAVGPPAATRSPADTGSCARPNDRSCW